MPRTQNDLLARLAEPLSSASVLVPEWEQSLAVYPDAPLPFLNPDLLQEWRAFCSIPAEADGPLAEAAQRIAASSDLSHLIWHAYRRLYLIPGDTSQFKEWPELRNALGESAGLFYLILGLAMVPGVKTAHSRLSVQEEVTRATCCQVFHFAEMYRRDYPNEWGLLRRQLYWLRHYPRAQLFRLGRFEYKLEAKDIPVWVFRNKDDGRTQTLARDGLLLDPRGYGRAEDGSGEPGFTANLTIEAGTVSGHPVSPLTGTVSREAIALPGAEWEKIVEPGDWVLDLHIPGGGGMSLELCRDSFARAFKFFDRYFPDRRAAAIVCHSWMFNPALSRILPPDSNLVRLLRDVSLYPVPRHPRDGFFFLFGSKGETADLSTLPRETSLQRAVLDHIAAGNPWQGGGMYLLREKESQ